MFEDPQIIAGSIKYMMWLILLFVTFFMKNKKIASSIHAIQTYVCMCKLLGLRLICLSWF